VEAATYNGGGSAPTPPIKMVVLGVLENGAHGVVQDPTDAAARGGKYCPLFKIREMIRMNPNHLHSHAEIVYSFHRETMKPTIYEFKEETILIELGPTTWLTLTDAVTVSVRRNVTNVCEEDLNESSSALTHSLHALIVCPKSLHLDFLLHGPLNPTQKRLVRPSSDV
jgi:hypothetical protein